MGFHRLQTQAGGGVGTGTEGGGRIDTDDPSALGFLGLFLPGRENKQLFPYGEGIKILLPSSIPITVLHQGDLGGNIVVPELSANAQKIIAYFLCLILLGGVEIELDGGRSALVFQKLILDIIAKHCACIFHQVGQVADLKGIVAPCNKKGRYKIDLFSGELEHKLDIIHQNTYFSRDLGRSAWSMELVQTHWTSNFSQIALSFSMNASQAATSSPQILRAESMNKSLTS